MRKGRLRGGRGTGERREQGKFVDDLAPGVALAGGKRAPPFGETEELGTFGRGHGGEPGEGLDAGPALFGVQSTKAHEDPLHVAPFLGRHLLEGPFAAGSGTLEEPTPVLLNAIEVVGGELAEFGQLRLNAEGNGRRGGDRSGSRRGPGRRQWRRNARFQLGEVPERAFVFQENGAVGGGDLVPENEAHAEDGLEVGRSRIQEGGSFARGSADELLEVPVQVGGAEAFVANPGIHCFVSREAGPEEFALSWRTGFQGLVPFGRGER